MQRNFMLLLKSIGRNADPAKIAVVVTLSSFIAFLTACGRNEATTNKKAEDQKTLTVALKQENPIPSSDQEAFDNYLGRSSLNTTARDIRIPTPANIYVTSGCFMATQIYLQSLIEQLGESKAVELGFLRSSEAKDSLIRLAKIATDQSKRAESEERYFSQVEKNNASFRKSFLPDVANGYVETNNGKILLWSRRCRVMSVKSTDQDAEKAADQDMFCAASLLRTAGLINQHLSDLPSEKQSMFKALETHYSNNAEELLARATQGFADPAQAKFGAAWADENVGKNLPVMLKDGQQKSELLGCLKRGAQPFWLERIRSSSESPTSVLPDKPTPPASLPLQSDDRSSQTTAALPPCLGNYDPNAWTECVGSRTTPTGDQYSGSYLNGKAHGRGAYTFADGRKYVGGYDRGIRNGTGTEFRPDGSVALQGRWAQGQYVGP